MSYCRVSRDSDVYVIMTRNPVEQQNILKCFCDEESNAFPYRSQMITHLFLHQQQGDKVPDRAFERLLREIEEEGDHC